MRDIINITYSVDPNQRHAFQTYTGAPFSYFNITPESIDDIDIIAHSLSNLCRFIGHSKQFYSVGQHSVLVSQQFDDLNLARWALLHDIGECYLGDIGRPVRRLLGPMLDIIESEIVKNAAIKYDLIGTTIPREVKVADDRMLATEKLLITANNSSLWSLGVEPYNHITSIPVMMPPTAKRYFLDRYNELFVT